MEPTYWLWSCWSLNHSSRCTWPTGWVKLCADNILTLWYVVLQKSSWPETGLFVEHDVLFLSCSPSFCWNGQTEGTRPVDHQTAVKMVGLKMRSIVPFQWRLEETSSWKHFVRRTWRGFSLHAQNFIWSCFLRCYTQRLWRPVKKRKERKKKKKKN